MCCKLNLETTSTLHEQQKSLVASICMWCKLDLKIVLAPHGNKDVGCIRLYVVQIRPKIRINNPWQQECGLHPLVCGANQTWKWNLSEVFPKHSTSLTLPLKISNNPF